jgi:hypothetical protein
MAISSERCRMLAAKTHKIADRYREPTARESLLFVAQAYELLAIFRMSLERDAERKSKSKKVIRSGLAMNEA